MVWAAFQWMIHYLWIVHASEQSFMMEEDFLKG